MYKTTEVHRATSKQWYVDNKTRHWEVFLRSAYGLELGGYKKLAEKQDNKCALCFKEETVIDRRTGNPRRLAVDHCHATGKIRGLLCFQCNTSLGKIGDSIESIQAILTYLQTTTIEMDK